MLQVDEKKKLDSYRGVLAKRGEIEAAADAMYDAGFDIGAFREVFMKEFPVCVRCTIWQACYYRINSSTL